MFSPITPIPPPLVVPQEPVKPRIDIPPIAPVQPSASESQMKPGERTPEELAEEAQERRRRRSRRTYDAAGGVDPPPPEGLSEALPDEAPRQGLWVDVQV